MKISIQVRQIDLGNTIAHLKKQMNYYGVMHSGNGNHVLLGDKFNIYVDYYPYALLPESIRTIYILPKDTPL